MTLSNMGVCQYCMVLRLKVVSVVPHYIVLACLFEALLQCTYATHFNLNCWNLAGSVYIRREVTRTIAASAFVIVHIHSNKIWISIVHYYNLHNWN